MNGLTTIRAYNKQEILQKEFDRIQDLHSGCYFMILGTSATFGLYIDMLSSIFCAAIVIYYMAFELNAPAVRVGLAISQALRLVGLLPRGERVFASLK